MLRTRILQLQQECAKSSGDAGEDDVEAPPEAPPSPASEEFEHVAYFAPSGR